jgi:Bromodomain
MSTPPSGLKKSPPPTGSLAGPSPTAAGATGSNAAAASAAASASAISASSPPAGAGPPNEEELRRQLRSLMQKLKAREPLDPTYRRLLMNGVVTRRKPILSKDKFYRRIGSSLRQRVETFCVENQGKDPFDRISQRQELEEDKMRAALNLREFKPHEQQPLLAATLAAMSKQRHAGGMDGKSRRRYLDSVALGLQTTKKMRRADVSAAAAAAAARFGGGVLGAVGGGSTTAASSTSGEQQQTEQVKLKLLKEQAHAREVARRKREELERQRREHENKTWRTGGGGSGTSNVAAENTTTPQQALYKVYHPIFKILWDMEFPNLGGTNPFRIPIDRDNCASMGAADYFDVIDVPMNLTYIQQKVEGMEYKTLSAFFDDVELVIRNALLYNTNVDNPYRVAAEELQKKYKRVQKKVLVRLQQQKAAASAAATAAGSR